MIVDFSQYAGQTLILYNDAPGRLPGPGASYDYYTGAPDLCPVGAPTILPGLRAQHPHRHADQGRGHCPGRPPSTWPRSKTPSGTKRMARACSSPASTRSSWGRRNTTRPTEPASSRAAIATPATPARSATGTCPDSRSGRYGLFGFNTLLRVPATAADPDRAQGDPRRDECGGLRRVRQHDGQHRAWRPFRPRRPCRTSSCTRTSTRRRSSSTPPTCLRMTSR